MQNTEEKPWGHDLDPLASGEARRRFRQQLRRLTNLDPLASGEARPVYPSFKLLKQVI